MVHIENILAPVDFSEPSRKAVNYGLSLAKTLKARLLLTHVAPDYQAMLDFAFPSETIQVKKGSFEEVQRRLEELVPEPHRAGIGFETIARTGTVRKELLRIVEEKQVDLVVMGSHGRKAFQRLVLGSVTENMLRSLPVPVLTVAHLNPAHEVRIGEDVILKKLLYATDLREGTEEGLHLSARLARGLNASLTVVHALDMMEQVMVGQEMVAYPPSYRDEIRNKMRKHLEEVVTTVAGDGAPIATTIVDGPAYRSINEKADEIGADLIVINLQGKARLERAFLGSNAERIIRSAMIPVLALPMPATYTSRWMT
jgi:nucleotide-binding universal stress UspA family protein